MRDPQVTMAMGFNTKPWSDDLDDLGVPPWLRKQPYILRDLATAGWFLWGFKWINSACCRTSLVVLVPWTCGLSLEHAGCPKISHSSPKSPSIIIFPIAILCSSETKNRFKHTHTPKWYEMLTGIIQHPWNVALTLRTLSRTSCLKKPCQKDPVWADP